MNEHIKKITAVTEVFPDGQRCIAAVLEYDKVLAKATVDLSAFAVSGRTITGVKVSAEPDGEETDGTFITLSLDPDDESARTYFPGEPWQGAGAHVEKAKVSVQQMKDLCAADGSILPAGGEEESTAVFDPLVSAFVTGSYEGLAYNLFIPRDYDPEKKYPLVQFIHDAAVCGPQHELTLTQGVGALVWMTREAQEKHPCFVLAPQYDMPSIVDDDWNVDHRLEVGKRLLDKIVSEYNIDRDRLYTTGQSMGGMSSMVLNIRYPDLFAASFFVAGQWDERAFAGAGLERKHFWFLPSEGDAKAFPGMNQILCVLEGEGAKIAREVWRTDWTQEEYGERAARLIASGADMIYTPYDITTVANGWHSNGGEHHINTWRTAYYIDAIHDWLFAQHR